MASLTRVEPFSKAAPGFNKEVAKRVYDAIMACEDDESANIMKRMLVCDVMMRDITLHGEFISKALRDAQLQRMEIAKKALAKQYANKKLAGEDVSAITKAAGYLEQLSKAQYTSYQHSQNARKQRRDARGRFVVEHTRIAAPAYRSKPTHNQIFDRVYGLPPGAGSPTHHWLHPSKVLSDTQQKHWQNTYAQIREMADPYQGHPGSKIHLNFGDKNDLIIPNDPDILRTAIPTEGRRVKSAAVSLDDSYQMPEGAPDFARIGAAFGAPAFGARVGATVGTQQGWDRSGLNPDRLKTYNDANLKPLPDNQYLQPGGRLFQRLGSGSSLLQDTLGNQAPPKVQAALSTASWVGDYGPEAQRVIGPFTQRTAYRYRGVEKQPNRNLVSSLNRINDPVSRQHPGDHGSDLVPARMDAAVENSDFVSWFKGQLPDANLNTLQRKSGTIPPSRGVVIDKDGKIVTEAVGYGDDWYLPFNLKNVGKMHGGSYIRTRTFGGPTTEDMYTALASGARSLTVVSWNGVYTVNFDKSFKGGRRYNDKAARMVSRYGQLLDAVNSGQVTLDLMDPARIRELRDEAANNVRNPDEPDDVEAEFQRLMRAERVHPKISEERKKEIQEDVLRDYAETQANRGRNVPTPEQVRQIAVVNAMRSSGMDLTNPEFQRDVQNPESVAGRQASALMASMQNNETLINALGLQDRYEKAQNREVAKYRRELSPLSLNGQGYNLALQALQEQFPYYIEKPIYREWEDPADRRDTGYIMPKHIRPEAAWSGYFDEKILGHGKVTAASVAGAKYRTPIELQQERERREERQAARQGKDGKKVESQDRIKTKVPAAARLDADMALAKWIHKWARSDEFGPGAGDLAGKSTESQEWLRQKGGETAEHKKLTAITSANEDDLQDMQDADDKGFHEKVMAAANVIRDMGFAEIPKPILEAARRGGAPAEAKDIDPDDLSSVIRRPREEYRLGNKFEINPNHTARSLTDTLATDPDILKLNLPKDFSDQDALRSALDQQTSDVQRQWQQIITRSQHGRWNDADQRELDKKSMGVLKAHALLRRYGELEPETATAPAASPQPGVVNQLAFIPVGGENPIEAFRQMLFPGGPPAIENTPQSSAEEDIRTGRLRRREET